MGLTAGAARTLVDRCSGWHSGAPGVAAVGRSECHAPQVFSSCSITAFVLVLHRRLCIRGGAEVRPFCSLSASRADFWRFSHYTPLTVPSQTAPGERPPLLGIVRRRLCEIYGEVR